MWRTNLTIILLVLGTLAAYTLVANSIPQMQSQVPQTLDLTGDLTPQQLVAAGEGVYNGAGGCAACHGLGTRAPNLLTDEKGTGLIGARCGSREPGKSCKDYLFEALTNPTAFVVPGYQPIMPDMRRTLPADQVWAVIAFLENHGGTVDVTSEDLRASQADAPSSTAAAPAAASNKPEDIIAAGGCMGCHALRGQGGTVAPSFDGIGARSNRDELRESILDPNAKVAPAYEAMRGVMPQTFGQQLTAGQLEALVTYLASLR